MDGRVDQPSFDELPFVYRARIRDIQQEFMDGDITQKGFDKRLAKIMQEYRSNSHAEVPSSAAHPPPSPYQDSPARQVRYADMQDDSSQSYSPVSGVSRSSSVAGARNGAGRPNYDARKSTVLGFRKPGINFDALLDDFEDEDDNEDSDGVGYSQLSRSAFAQPVAGSRGLPSMRSPPLDNSRGSPFQLSPPPVPKVPGASRTPYNVGRRVVDDTVGSSNNASSGWAAMDQVSDDDDEFGGDINSGRALHVLNDIMDPYGAQSSPNNQELYSDSASSNGMLDDLDSLGPSEFNPDIITESAMSGSRAALADNDYDQSALAVPGEDDSDGDNVSETSSVEVKRMNSLLYPRNGRGRGGRAARGDDLRRQISKQQSHQDYPMAASPSPFLPVAATTEDKPYTADVVSFDAKSHSGSGIPESGGGLGGISSPYEEETSKASAAAQPATSQSPRDSNSPGFDGNIEAALKSRALLAKQAQTAGDSSPISRGTPPSASMLTPVTPGTAQFSKANSETAVSAPLPPQALSVTTASNGIADYSEDVPLVSAPQSAGDASNSTSPNPVDSRKRNSIYSATTDTGPATSTSGGGSITLEDLALATSSSSEQPEHAFAQQTQAAHSSATNSAAASASPNNEVSEYHAASQTASPVYPPLPADSPRSPVVAESTEPVGQLADALEQGAAISGKPAITIQMDSVAQQGLASPYERSEHASSVGSPTRMQRSSIQSAAFGGLAIAGSSAHASPIGDIMPLASMPATPRNHGSRTSSTGNGVMGYQPLADTQEAADMDSHDFEFPVYGEPITRSGRIDDSDNDDQLSAHENFDDLPLGSDSHPQPQPSVANRVARRPTHSARSDRGPLNAAAGGAGRASYYAPESELEVPANFDVPVPVSGVGSAAVPIPADSEGHSAAAAAAAAGAATLSAGLASGLAAGYTNHNGSDNGFDLEVDSSDPRVVGTNYPAQYPSSSSRPSATARDASLSLPNTAPLEGPSVVIAGLSPAPASAPLLDTPMANLPPASNEYEQQDYGQWQPGTYDASTTQPSALSSIGAIVYPREIPEDVSSHQLKQLMALHQNLPSVLRHRAATTPNAIAYTCIDTKGKEIGSWTWSGLHTRAIHVVQLLRQKGVSVWGDRVALVYRKYEMLEFVGSLFGCFYAGLCAVPIVAGDSYAELVHVLNSTSAVLVLTSELNVKSLNKDLNQNNVGPGWPTDVAWVRTDNLGGCTLSSIGAQSPSSQYHPRQAADNYYSSKTDTKIDDIGPDDIAYIEFSKSPNGELKGVQVTHGAIMTQCAGWMMSTGMLGVGRKYKHRVELEQDEPASASYYSQAIVDPNNELGADSPPSTPSSALGTPAVAGLGKYSSTAASSPVAEQEHHHGSFGKKWGSSSGFLGRLRNVGSLPRIRKGSRAKDHPVQSGGSPRMSTTSVRNSMASQTVADGRARAASSTSASQQQRLQQGDDGLGLSPGSIQKNPTRLSAVSRATTINNAGGSLDAGNDSASRPRGASSTSPPAAKDVVVFYIEPRQHFGLVYGILGGCYGGHQSVYTSSALCDIPGAYINLLTRYWATVAVGDYTGLQSVLSAATDEPSQITDYSKKTPPNLASLRLCLVDTLFIDPVFHTTFNRNVLHPFGCPYQSIADAEGHPVMTAVCTLAEHGSVLMAMRDCLSSCTPPNVDDGPGMGYEFVLDREAFKENRVVILPDERNEAEVDRIGTVRYQSFGFPALNATIAVVDPETRELCAPDSIGELWIASPSLGSGFWGLPKLTSSIFAARFTYSVEQDVELVSSSTYLRTGLMGALVLGRVLVFGFYEDRIRTLTIEPSPDVPVGTPAWYIEPTLGFHYAGDINSTIRRYLPQISECTAFEMFANETHFPVIAAEVRHNSGMFSTIAEEVYGVLRNRHGLYAYAVALCPPNTLPRAFQYGKRTVNAQLCRHQFESGKINCLYVKISTDNLFMNLPPPASTLPEGQFGDIEDPSVALYGRWLQQTSLEEGMPSVDERSGTDLCTFGSITEILIWRAAKYPEEIAYSQFDERGRVAKSLTFQKLLTKVSAVAQLMLEKKRVGAGDHVLVVMTPSPSFVVAIHACLAIGAVPIPIAPPDVNRLSDDMPPLLATAREFRVNYMLVNAHSEDIFRSKMMEGAMRAQALRSLLGSHRMPGVIAVTKASKSPKYLLGRGSFKFSRQWSEPTRTALVMQFTGTQASTPQYVSYTHRAILGFCSQQKGDFQMLHSLPVIASVRAYNGYGLLHCSMIGIYVGCMTLLLSPVDFFSSPNVWFELVQRYKVKDAFTTLPMLQHAMNSLSAHGGQLGFSLHAVRNFILATEERVDPATYLAVRDFFARARLDEMAVNPLYGTLMNPCISTRAYLGVSPLTLRLDTHAMRRGRVVALPPLTEMDGAEDAELHSLTLQDSGKVSGSTMVAIVDPVTRQALPAGCIGEVWVCSSSNASKKQTLVPGVVSAGGKAGRPAMAMSNSTGYLDGSKDNEFVRTGDLGFLYLQVSEDDQDGAPAEPYLFVAGRTAETFNVDEYLYFYSDIERAVEDSSSDLVPGGCVVLQTTIQSSYSSNSGGGNLDGGNSGGRSRDAPTESSRLRLVAVISLRRSPSDSFLPNAACLIFNSVLDRHQVLLDEIVFVPRDSLPRSRISERRRRTVRGLYESGKLNAFVSYPISNSPTLSSGIANPNNRQSFVGPPAGNSSALAFLNDSSSAR